jgi:hypothetical protein
MAMSSEQPMTAVGRSETDFLLQTRHSARQARDRRHPASHNPELPDATGRFRAIKSRTPKNEHWRLCTIEESIITLLEDSKQSAREPPARRDTSRLPRILELQDTGRREWAGYDSRGKG